MILDSILDHCGNVFCWRSCGFWRTKESKDTKVKKIKKSSKWCHNKLEFGVWPALDFLTFTIFTERSESVVCWGSCCGSCAYTWCGHLSCCWCLQCPCFILMLHPSTHWPKIQGSLGFLGGFGAGDVRCYGLKADLALFCKCRIKLGTGAPACSSGFCVWCLACWVQTWWSACWPQWLCALCIVCFLKSWSFLLVSSCQVLPACLFQNNQSNLSNSLFHFLWDQGTTSLPGMPESLEGYD